MPANVHRMHGNASKKPIGELVDGVQPIVEIPGCPAHLLTAAKAEWKRIAPLLQELGLIAKIDRAALALYCQAYAWWVWHESCLRDDIARVAAKRKEFESLPDNAGKEWTGGDGFTIATPNGSFTYNAHWVGKNKAAEQVDKFLQSFGLSPSARARVTPSDNYPYLPGMEPAQTGPAPATAKIASLADFAKPA